MEVELCEALLAGQASAPSRMLDLLIDRHRAQRNDGLRLATDLLGRAPEARVALLQAEVEKLLRAATSRTNVRS